MSIFKLTLSVPATDICSPRRYPAAYENLKSFVNSSGLSQTSQSDNKSAYLHCSDSTARSEVLLIFQAVRKPGKMVEEATGMSHSQPPGLGANTGWQKLTRHAVLTTCQLVSEWPLAST